MAETHCGKTCIHCPHKEALHCPGCKTGPGARLHCACDLAKCCMDKGHETCETCGFRSGCGTFQRRELLPEHRLWQQNQTAANISRIAEKAPLGKPLRILFWLRITAIIFSFLSQLFPGGVLQQIPSFLVSVACGAILLTLAEHEKRYQLAGICALVGAVLTFLPDLLPSSAAASLWLLLLYIPVLILAFVAEYQEYMAHSGVLYGVDSELSEKWRKLWNWYIGLLGALIVSILLCLLLPTLGLLLVLAASIGVLVVGILRLIYLYRTSALFLELSANSQ